MIRVRSYRQKEMIKSYEKSVLTEKHRQASMVVEVWFLFILIYRSRTRITDTL